MSHLQILFHLTRKQAIGPSGLAPIVVHLQQYCLFNNIKEIANVLFTKSLNFAKHTHGRK